MWQKGYSVTTMVEYSLSVVLSWLIYTQLDANRMMLALYIIIHQFIVNIFHILVYSPFTVLKYNGVMALYLNNVCTNQELTITQMQNVYGLPSEKDLPAILISECSRFYFTIYILSFCFDILNVRISLSLFCMPSLILKSIELKHLK